NFVSCVCFAFGLTAITAHFWPALNAHSEWAGAMLAGLTMLAFVGIAIPSVAPEFEYQADFFACRHMAGSIREEPSTPADVACVPLLEASFPPELAGALCDAPTATESMTLAQYVAEYP